MAQTPDRPTPPRPLPAPTPRSPAREPRAAGAFIALAVVVGAIVGTALRQPSAGVVGGAVVGIAIAVILWLGDRRR